MLLRNGKTTNKVNETNKVIRKRRLPHFVWKSLTPKPSVETLHGQLQDLEHYIKQLQDQNYLLEEENSELREETYLLQEQNSELREQLTWN